MNQCKIKLLTITFLAALFLIVPISYVKSSPVQENTDHNDSNAILLINAKIDTSITHSSKAAGNIVNSQSRADDDGFYIVQFKGHAKEEWKQALRESGAVLYDYVPNDAFIARMNSSAKSHIEALDMVQWIGSYMPEYRISPVLSSSSAIMGQEIKNENISVLLFDAGDNKRVSDEITGLGGEIVSNPGNRIRVSISRTGIPDISHINGVSWIEKYVQPVILNDVAANITNVYSVSNTHGLTGAGQIVAVADTGLDTGVNDNTMHADVRGRIAAMHAWWSLYGDSGAQDNNGHGTHVTGSILGNGSRSNGKYAGMAPEARLVFQAMQYDGAEPSMDGLFFIPTDLSLLFQEAYNDGAKIHSNSWGSDDPTLYGNYTSDSQYVDSFMWNNPDMLIVFAAGNEGGVENTVLPPATAKNAISVGASENLRIDNGSSSNNIDDIAFFSSRGFTDDNRIKPDIVAPGTYMISTRSSQPGVNYVFGTLDQNYSYNSGTSMATPIVAGAAALVRQFYMDNKSISPSAALIKATLINGAFNMSLSKKDQGWGRMNIENSLFPLSPRSMLFYDNIIGLNIDQSWNTSYYVENSSEPLRVTIVWSDYPAIPSAGITLVNNLDLILTGPGGTYYGNGAPDNRNNVEQVEFVSPSAGSYTIRINGTDIPQGPQPFALVISGAGFLAPDFSNEFPENNSFTNNNTTNVAVNITDQSGLNLSSINMTINGSPVTFSNTTIANGYRIQNLTIAPFGDGIVNISVNATNNNSKSLNHSWSFVIDTKRPTITINPVSYERGTAAKTGSIIGFNVSAYDPVSNSTSSGLKNASVNVSLINNTGIIALTNNSGFWKGNVTFDRPIDDGNYSLNVSFSDNAGNTNSSENINISIDNTPPSVEDELVSPSLINISDQVNITANITSLDAVSQVNDSEIDALITYPDGTCASYPMSNGSNNSYYVNFSGTAQYGRYNVTILANDTTGNTNNTRQITFSVSRISNLEVNLTGNNTGTISFAPFSNTSLQLYSNNSTNGTIQISQSKYNITSNALGIANPGIYVLINASQNIRDNMTFAVVSVNYTDADISSYVESSLRLYRWNNTSSAWEKLSGPGSPSFVVDAGVDTVNNYVWANITKLSEFAISGDIYQEQQNNAPSGGGGGGGGGGGASGENQSNIIVIEKYDLSIYKDKVTSFRFMNSANPILYVNITGNISFGDITTSVEVLKSNSTMVNIQPPGVVYKNVNIWAGTSGFNKPKNIKEGMIRFKVDNSWIDDNSITDLRMVMWEGSDWSRLETNQIAKDSDYTYYEASTRSFANFAITGTKGQKSVQFSAPVQKTQITQNQSAAPVSHQTKKSPGFGISTLFLSGFAFFLFLRRRK